MTAERPVVSVDTRLAEIEQREQAATPGEWFFTGYSAVQSAPKVIPHDEFWSDERVNDGHTYEHHAGVTCPSCGERWYLVNGKHRGRLWDCARAAEALDMEPTVAHVTASYGDTATGQRVADAEFIAHARADVPWLLSQLRDARAENEQWQARLTDHVDCDLRNAAELRELRAESESLLDLLRVADAERDDLRTRFAAAEQERDAIFGEALRYKRLRLEEKARADRAETALAAVRALRRQWASAQPYSPRVDLADASSDLDAALAAAEQDEPKRSPRLTRSRTAAPLPPPGPGVHPCCGDIHFGDGCDPSAIQPTEGSEQ